MKSPFKISAVLSLILCGSATVWAQTATAPASASVAAPATASPAGKDIATATVTVKELIKIDNEQALRKAREEAGRTGLFTGGADESKSAPRPQSVAKPPPTRFEVYSIYGAANEVKATLSINDILVDGVAAGSKVGQCTVSLIDAAAGCVSLQPAAVAVPKSDKKGSKTTQKAKTVDAKGCPARVCWTGEQMAERIRPSQAVSSQSGALSQTMAAPVPLPLPAGGPVALGARGTPGGGYLPPSPMRSDSPR